MWILALTAVFCCFVVGSFIAAAFSQYNQLMNLFEVVDSSGKWHIIMNDVLKQNLTWILGGSVLYTVVTAYVVSSFTHRIYGPMVAIKRQIENLSDGVYHRRCELREGDEFEDVAQALNALSETLQKKHGHIAESGNVVSLKNVANDR